MRIRSIKPEFWRSPDISKHALEDRLLFVGLWSYVDDNGVGRDSLAAIAADLFADDLQRDPRETFARVHRGLAALFAGGQIVRYVSEDDKELIYIVNWQHQKIDRPSKPRYPLPTRSIESLASDSRDPRETPSEDSLRARVGSRDQGNKGTGDQGSRGALASLGAPRATRLAADWRPPEAAAEQMRDECPTVDLIAESRRFADHWAAKPGKDGTKLDWTATWRNWIRRAAELNPHPPGTNGKTRRQAETDQQFDQMLAEARERDQHPTPPPRKAINT